MQPMAPSFRINPSVALSAHTQQAVQSVLGVDGVRAVPWLKDAWCVGCIVGVCIDCVVLWVWDVWLVSVSIALRCVVWVIHGFSNFKVGAIIMEFENVI